MKVINTKNKNITDSILNNFTGIYKVINSNAICYFKNGKLHRKNGAAIIYMKCKAFHYYINGLPHREDGPSHNYDDGVKNWYFKDKCYGSDNDFTIESWKEKVKELKRQEELKIFI